MTNDVIFAGSCVLSIYFLICFRGYIIMAETSRYNTKKTYLKKGYVCLFFACVYLFITMYLFFKAIL